ncbi:MAG TPA: hypothetical protein PLK35_02935 [Candidatus Moranbacteria bacterium]|nr:hypothetical protein [Candidatus Moranbacteria bacterium]
MTQIGPKNTEKYFWTEHVKFKMKYYGLSPQKVLGIISKPKRKEEGIVEKTIAVMKPVSSKKVDGKEIWKQEIWAMYQRKIKGKGKVKNFGKGQIKIISAWRYPGVSPQKNPIPENILEDILNIKD